MVLLQRDLTYSVAWNLFIMTLGGVLFAAGMKGAALPHGFISGGLFGVALLVSYSQVPISAGWIFLLLNLPFFAFGLMKVSRRFFLYSLYTMAVTTMAYEFFPHDFGIKNQIYAALAAGAVGGAGAGIVLRSLGSMGGLDILAVYLNRKWNLGIGKFYFLVNLVLFSFALGFMDVDLVIASLILVSVMSGVTEYFLAMFNDRKLVFIISEAAEEICAELTTKLHRSATWLRGWGAYTRREKPVLLTVVNSIHLKRLEEIVFTADPHALFIVENTFSVLGASFSKRKLL